MTARHAGPMDNYVQREDCSLEARRALVPPDPLLPLVDSRDRVLTFLGEANFREVHSFLMLLSILNHVEIPH